MSKVPAVKIGCAAAAAFWVFGVALAAGAETLDYAQGLKKAQQAIADGRLGVAESTLGRLAARYRNDPELFAMRGRVLFWQKRYAESIESYRAARKLRPTPELGAELDRVEVAQQLDEADRLVAQKKDARARALLTRLFDAGKEPYESGLRLAKLEMRGGRNLEASEVLARMLERYPGERDLVLLKAQALLGAARPEQALEFLAGRPESGRDAELLALRGRSQLQLGRYREASESFSASLALADDPQLRRERERAELGDFLERCDRLIAQGDARQAIELLRRGFEQGRDRYGTGTRLASLHTRNGNQEEAVRVYQLLTVSYPADPELALLYARSLANAGQGDAALAFLDGLPAGTANGGVSALRGRILFGKGEYSKAEAAYDEALGFGFPAAEAAKERDELRAAAEYRELQALLAAGEYRKAGPLVASLSGRKGYAREARLAELRILLARRQDDRALAAAGALERDYPGDTEVAALKVEALILAGEGGKAQELLGSLGPQRDDVYYRVRDNWVKLYGGSYGLSDGFGSENTLGVAASGRVGGVTAVAAVAGVNRFGGTDEQVALDLYFPRSGGSNLYGSLSLTVAPEARFLPQNSLGLEIDYALSPCDLALGYTRLNFMSDRPGVFEAAGNLFDVTDREGANVVSAAVLWYLRGTPLALGEKLYYVPERGTVMSVTSLRWDPGYRWHAFAALGAGNSSERIDAAATSQDVQRYATFSLRAGGEYRIAPSYSVGGEALYETRRGLYQRAGATAFVKYWWP